MSKQKLNFYWPPDLITGEIDPVGEPCEALLVVDEEKMQILWEIYIEDGRVISKYRPETVQARKDRHLGPTRQEGEEG